MKVLVACEESQTVCKAFREKGHEAYSCDLQDCSGGHPEWHINDDALKVLKGGELVTRDGKKHTVAKWDILIAHPPCTYLSNAGAARLYKNIRDGEFQMLNVERLKKGILARDFFMALWNANVEKIAIENPVPSGVYMMPKPSQVVQPYEYGHPYSKKTYLWLKGLPRLVPTEIVCGNIISWVSGGSKRADGSKRSNTGTKYRDSKTRSKTFEGIAKAMAEQWASIE